LSRVFTLSDAHCWHELVADLRGFSSAAEHHAALDDAVRSRVTKRDHMWWLGDMTAGGKIPQMLKWVASLPGTHHLVAGNHCPVHPMHGGHSRQWEYLRAFASVQTIAQRKIGGRKVLLSHFPIVGDHTERPHLDQWRPRPFNGVLLHGHTHSDRKLSITPEGTVQVHVGIDAWGMTPVSDDQILALIESA
jgi:calcineurin-like phosphoesterase family protein